jgi:GDP-L-fucose synthase
MHVDDLASGLWHLCLLPDPPDVVNLGTGTDVTILELAHLIADTVGYRGSILTDPTKPDGTPVKLTDVRRAAATGWQATIDLPSGLAATYQAFLSERMQHQLRES